MDLSSNSDVFICNTSSCQESGEGEDQTNMTQFEGGLPRLDNMATTIVADVAAINKTVNLLDYFSKESLETAHR